MIAIDVNVLLYAFRPEADRHAEFRRWTSELFNGGAPFGISDQVLTAVMRVSTNPKVYQRPATWEEVIGFANAVRDHPACRLLRPGELHWELFTQLCQKSGAKGNLVTDAWFAALAIESGCTWITTDRDYARFPGLTWQHPLEHKAPVRNPG